MKGHGGHEPWPVCPVCNLSAVDVTPTGCPDPRRCANVIRGLPLGRAPLDATKVDIDALPEPPELEPLVIEEEAEEDEPEPKLVLLNGHREAHG